MTHLDPSVLAQYNSLIDPHLQSYFSNERIQTHLKHAGLISNRGEIVSDAEYRTRLARREHKRHVRHVLAENIVNRAIDMERARQAEMRRQFESVTKAALVNNIKEARRRSGNYSGMGGSPSDMALLSVDTSWAQTRPRSANCCNETPQEQMRIPRVESAHTGGDDRKKYPSKSRRRRSRLRSKNRSSTHPRSSTKCLDSSSTPCQIRMIYYGPKIQVDYDHLVFEPIDEIIVMQQHCGGENVIVYKENLKPGAQFTFNSRRHSDYPFGLTFYVKGFIDSRISTCCEYKHHRGVRLGGDRGHFAIISVKGSKPCIKCRFEKQARLKKYADSPKEKDDQNKKSITVPLPVSDEPKREQPPVQIPVRHTSISNDRDSGDSDDSDRRKHSDRNGHSTDSSTKPTHKNKRKSKTKEPEKSVPIVRKKVSRKSSTSSDDTLTEEPKMQKWKMIFHATEISAAKDSLIKFSFISNNGKNQTEYKEINMKNFDKHSKTDKQYAFTVKLEDIGQPEQIRLKMQKKDDDDDDEDDDEDIKWHLDYIELIDPKTKSHSIFPCKQWIRLSQEKLLRISQETSRSDRQRKSSFNSDDSYQITPKVERKSRVSSSSSTSSNLSKQPLMKPTTIRRVSRETDSNRSLKSSPESDNADQGNPVRYRVTIYPSNDQDGVFYPVRNSRIFLRLNKQKKETNLTDRTCPEFAAGVKQTFQIDLKQNENEKPKKLTIGYVNSDITASKWKLEKVVLQNIQTGDQSIFPCKQILVRDDSNFRAEKTFEVQSKDSDEESTPRNPQIVYTRVDVEAHIKPTQIEQKTNRFDKRKSSSSSDDDKPTETPIKQRDKQRTPSIQSKSDREEETETPKKQRDKQRTPSIQSKSDREEQTDTPKQPQPTEKIHRKTPSIQSLNNDQTPKTSDRDKQKSPSIRSINDNEKPSPKTNGTSKERSPSFQSMNDDEAHYTKIFKKLDPDNKLDLYLDSEPPTPPSRPKTRRGPQDQSDEHPPVVPPVDLEGLDNQTARSNDQLTLNSLPSTTTDHTENHSRRRRTTDRDDEDD